MDKVTVTRWLRTGTSVVDTSETNIGPTFAWLGPAVNTVPLMGGTVSPQHTERSGSSLPWDENYGLQSCSLTCLFSPSLCLSQARLEPSTLPIPQSPG